MYGFGDNVLPTIHVSDLASFIIHVAVTLPPQQHLLAVDDARCTQQALVEVRCALPFASLPFLSHTLLTRF